MASKPNLRKQLEQAIAYDDAAHRRETYRVANEECWLKGKKMDKWDRKTGFNCNSCMFYVPKMVGLPDGKGGVRETPEDFGRCRRQAPTMKGFPVVYGNADWCGEHKIGSNPVRDGKKDVKPYEHPMGQADNKPLTKEDARKVLDEPLTSPAWDQPLVKTDALIKNMEEKAKIKAEIDDLLSKILIGDIKHRQQNTDYLKEIRELLEKL